jgi:hypothetical protein
MNEKMRQGFYCGPVEHLAGRRALVREGVEGCKPGHVLVQFADPVAVNSGRAYLAGGAPLNVGWHAFPASDFDLDVEYE